MKIGILSSDLAKYKKIELPIELKKIINACDEKFGENNTFLLNPLNFQVNFINGNCIVKYFIDKKNIFDSLDVILVLRTRELSKEIYDLIKILGYLDKKPLILDPIESFDNPLSKISSYLIRFGYNIKQPNTYIFWLNAPNIDMEFNPPFIIKPVYGYRGHCVNKIQKYEIKQYIERCLEESSVEEIGNAFLIQENINIKNEYRVLVLNGKSLGCVRKISERVVKNADQGARFVKEPIKKVMKLAEKVAKIQKLFFAGVDIAEDNNGELYVLECNRNPQFRAFEEAYLRAGDNIDIAKKVIDEVYNLTHKRQKINSYEINIKNYDIFISYPKEDFIFAKELKEILSKYGLEIWFDESKVKLTDDGVDKSLLFIEESKLVLTIFSRAIFNLNKDRTFFKEIEKVLYLEKKYNKKVSIPILLQSIDVDELKQNSLLEKYFQNRRLLYFIDKNKIVEKIVSEILYLYKNDKKITSLQLN